VLAAVGYSFLALVVWWHVWTGHPGRTTTCGCGDPSFSLWFFEFAAHALRTGQSPLFTTLLGYPHGINVLDEASQLGLGLLLAPVTWTGGAVLAMNVALTLAPLLSALACYALLDHWRLWRPAAFAGGLVYGFSPFVVMNLAEAHLVVGFAAVPPLIVLCLDELIVRDPRRPVTVGIVLGLLTAFQFFVSSEVLVITGLACAVGIGLVVGAAAARRRPIAERWGRAWPGLAVGALTAAVLLAYPVWFALAGPGHVSGAYYPNSGVAFSGASVRGFLLPTPVSEAFGHYMARIGGYQGPNLSTQYFGLGLAAVVVAGLLVWRRDSRLLLAGSLGLVFAVFSLGSSASGWRPWDLVAHMPLLENVIPVRLLLVTYLCAGVLVAAIGDHVRRTLRTTWAGVRGKGALADAVALVVLVVAVAPPAIYLSQTLPLTTQPVVLPTWFRQVAPRLDTHQVLLVVPVPFGAIQSSLTWQSESHLSFAMAGGDGPGSSAYGPGGHTLARRLLAAVSASFDTPPVGPEGIAAVRAALDDWGVTQVVLPDQADLPAYDKPFAPAAAAGLITAAVGRPPVIQAQAWVWPVGRPGPPAVTVSTANFARCTTTSDMASVVGCILDLRSDGSHPSPGPPPG